MAIPVGLRRRGTCRLPAEGAGEVALAVHSRGSPAEVGVALSAPGLLSSSQGSSGGGCTR